MSELNLKKIDSLLEKLLLNRIIRLDRFDASYIHDFHYIMREDYKIKSTLDKTNSDFVELIAELPSVIFSSNPDVEIVTNALLKSDINVEKYRPILASNESKSKHNYDGTEIWQEAKNKKLSEDKDVVNLINKLQVEYSLNQGGDRNLNWDKKNARFWHRSDTNFGKIKFGLINQLFDQNKLTSDSSVLTIGPRWQSEILFFREALKLKKTIGLDLFSKNEKLITVGDMHSMPFDDNSFDMVYQRNTFNKSYDLRKTLSECTRVLKTGGILVSDDGLDYNIGVSELARSNVTSNDWYTRCLGDFVKNVLLNKESWVKEYYLNKAGLYAVEIQK